MKYPKNLRKNDIIGFIAPSFGCAIEPYETAFRNSLIKWTNLGYRYKLGPNCFENKGIGISNDPKKCGEEVNEAFLDTEISCIISCGGGELMCEILDDIDFQLIISQEPKWFMGYSDNTNLTFLLTTICDMASIYGPCAAAFGMEPWHESIVDAYQLLQGNKMIFEGYELWEKESLKNENNPLSPYNVTEKRDLKLYLGKKYATKVEMKGRLLGGCLDCLSNLIGTKYDQVEKFIDNYQEDGIVWFLEACELNVFSIRRALWQMEQANWFKNVSGFLIGRPLMGEAIMNLDHIHAVIDILGKYNVPIILDMDLGHVAPMIPIVNGSIGVIQAEGDKMSLAMEFM